MRFDILKCQVDFASTIVKIGHTYNLLPVNINYPSHQQFYEIFSAALGQKSYASLKTNPDVQLRSDDQLARQRIEKLYLKLNPKVKAQYLSKSIEFSVKLIEFINIHAPCADFRRLAPQEMLMMGEVRVHPANSTLFKKPSYKSSISAMYVQAINGNDWLKLFSLPILHRYYDQAIDNWAKVNITEAFSKQINDDYILIFNIFWIANFSSSLEPQNKIFLNDDMSKYQGYPSEFQALINFNLYM